jgi:glyoxylase-like metal-dependent hydrolase (beta-lactamase superfamily II)
VGRATLTPIVELADMVRPAFAVLAGLSEEILAEQHAVVGGDYVALRPAQVRMSIHAWLIRHAGRMILVDPCFGNGKDRGPAEYSYMDTPWLTVLGDAGAGPDDIDLVICTHLHSDHVGWNTVWHSGRWVPTFPNATYVFSGTDLRDRQETPDRPGVSGCLEDSVLPVIEAGQAWLTDLGDAERELDDGITLIPTPGHSPGHMAVQLTDQDHSALLIGDILHSPLQIAHPEIGCLADASPAQAALTRRHILQRAARTSALILPGHFRPPHAGHVRPGPADRYRWEWITP